MQPTPTRSPTENSLHLGADGRDDARDLVAGDHREDRHAPLVPRLVDVGVADAAVLDVDLHVVAAAGRAARSWCRRRTPRLRGR